MKEKINVPSTETMVKVKGEETKKTEVVPASVQYSESTMWMRGVSPLIQQSCKCLTS